MTTTISAIMTVVSRRYDVPVGSMWSPDRHRQVAHPRQVAMFLSRRLTRRSYPVIGRLFARDHTTVIHACRAVGGRLRSDPKARRDVARIIRSLAPAAPSRNPRRQGLPHTAKERL